MVPEKVIHVSAYYPPHLGGQEIAVQELAERLTSATDEIAVVTSDLGSTAGVTVENGVRVTRLKSYEFAHTAIIWRLFFWLVGNTDKETIVHLHVGQFFTPEMVWLASKIVGFKYIIHFHADFIPSGAMGKLLPLYKKLFLGNEIRDAALAVVLSEDSRRDMLVNYPNAKKVVVRSNGISDDFFKVSRISGNTEIRLLFVGRLIPAKNLEKLFEALNLIEGNFVLDVVGDGECRQDLENLVTIEKLPNVTFHGRLSREEVMHFYSTCSALVLPSIHEAQGIVLLEAMACRVPIITSKATGLIKTLEGVAILVEPTVQGIKEGITRFAAMSTSEVKVMVDNAFRRVQEFSWNILIKSYTDLYEMAQQESRNR